MRFAHPDLMYLSRERDERESERAPGRLNSINSIILRKQSVRDNGPVLTNRFLRRRSSSAININTVTVRGAVPARTAQFVPRAGMLVRP